MIAAVGSTDSAASRLVSELSALWVATMSNRLTQSGRRLQGGWPGTLSEARTLLYRRVGGPATNDARRDFESMVRRIYREAKRRWRELADT